MDPLDYTAQLKARGLDGTGFTTEHARQAANSLGRRSLLIVEVLHDELTTKAEGEPKVKLKATMVEVVPEAQEDVVRDFIRAIYRTRPEVEGQETLRGTTDGPSVEDTAAALSAHLERDDTGSVTGVWSGDPSDDGTQPAEPDAPLEPTDADGPDGPWPGDPDYVTPGAGDDES